MNIYFTGAGGTGKTTTANLLAQELDMQQAPSLSRTSPYAINTKEHQDYVQGATFERTIELDNHILDRTPFDVLGYDYGYGFGTHERGLQYCRQFISVIRRTKEPLVYFPRYWEAEDDGFRPTDKKLLDTVDFWIRQGVEASIKAGARVYIVNNEPVEERVKNIIGQFKIRKGGDWLADLLI